MTQSSGQDTSPNRPPSPKTSAARSTTFKPSDLIVEGIGEVIRLLEDDLDGSRHQRFIVRLDTYSVLIVHNIDLSPRITSLSVGDFVSFKGEYEWNDRGGLVHWTHKDPKAWHPDGWIEHNGQRYE